VAQAAADLAPAPGLPKSRPGGWDSLFHSFYGWQENDFSMTFRRSAAG